MKFQVNPVQTNSVQQQVKDSFLKRDSLSQAQAAVKWKKAFKFKLLLLFLR